MIWLYLLLRRPRRAPRGPRSYDEMLDVAFVVWVVGALAAIGLVCSGELADALVLAVGAGLTGLLIAWLAAS